MGQILRQDAYTAELLYGQNMATLYYTAVHSKVSSAGFPMSDAILQKGKVNYMSNMRAYSTFLLRKSALLLYVALLLAVCLRMQTCRPIEPRFFGDRCCCDDACAYAGSDRYAYNLRRPK